MKSVQEIRAKYKELSGIEIFSRDTSDIGYQRWLEGELLKRYITLDNKHKNTKKGRIYFMRNLFNRFNI